MDAEPINKFTPTPCDRKSLRVDTILASPAPGTHLCISASLEACTGLWGQSLALAMAQSDQQFQQQAQPTSRQHVTGKSSRQSNAKDRKLQANGSPSFDPTQQDTTQIGNAFGRPSRQSSGSTQNMTASHGNGAPTSRHFDPATISRLPQAELEQIQISRRAEIARLQAVSGACMT